MDNNTRLKAETVKEVSKPTTNTPSTFPTPAHPLPKFLTKKLLVVVLIIWILIMAAIYGVNYYIDKQATSIVDFETCAAAGNPIMESYPATCRTNDGRSFTQVLSEISPTYTTTDLKTYTNDEFTFKYPAVARIEESEDKDAFVTHLNSKVVTVKKDEHDPVDNSSAEDNFILEVSISENPNNLTPKQIIENYKLGLGKNTEGRTDGPYLTGTKQMADGVISKINSTMKEFKLNEILGSTAKFGSDYDVDMIIMSKNKKIYTFFYHDGEGGAVMGNAENSVNQILSSFEFTK